MTVVCCDLTSFTRCGFHIPGSQKFIDLDLLIGKDDDLADIQGRFTFATIVVSELRQMWLLSWPHGLVLLNSDDDNLVTTVVDQFHSDYLLYMALVEMEGKVGFHFLVLKMSLFQLTTVMQFVHAFIESGWKVAVIYFVAPFAGSNVVMGSVNRS